MARLAFLMAALVLLTSPVLAGTNAKAEKAKAEKGIASVYSTALVGHATASGELLDSERLTAAHRKLPFGTRVEVTNKRNGRKIIVTVNDRGPVPKGRIIDLSPAAAEELGMKRAGLAPVELRIASRR